LKDIINVKTTNCTALLYGDMKEENKMANYPGFKGTREGKPGRSTEGVTIPKSTPKALSSVKMDTGGQKKRGIPDTCEKPSRG